jgi:hypothetical protein
MWQIARPGWKLERALRRLRMFDKARCELAVTKARYRQYCREMWFALVADDTMEHGLDPEWTIEVEGT